MDGSDRNTFESKVVMLGDTGIGKTSISVKFVKGLFNASLPSTVGASYLSKTVGIEDSQLCLQIWDTAGQERFRSLAQMYYRGAEAAVITYDITSESSFSRAKDWLHEVVANIDDDLVLAVVGNKLDLADLRQVETSRGMQFAHESNASFLEVSAKTGEGITELFFEISQRLLAKKLGKANSNVPPASMILSRIQEKDRDKDSCCG